MNLQEAYKLMDLLLDKADQPYFTDEEKNMFLDQSIMSFINHHYSLYEQEQVSRDALQAFQINMVGEVKNGQMSLHQDYVHIIYARINNSQVKILGSKQFFDNQNSASSDPFNKATIDNPIGYVYQNKFFYDPFTPPISGEESETDQINIVQLIFRNRDTVFSELEEEELEDIQEEQAATQMALVKAIATLQGMDSAAEEGEEELDEEEYQAALSVVDKLQNLLMQQTAEAQLAQGVGVREIYQREIIDIAVRKMTGNIESANIQYQQIEAEQSKSI